MRVFTTKPELNTSKKFLNPWAGPFIIDEILAPTSYKVAPWPDTFSNQIKPAIVKLDQIKEFHDSDPIVTPPPPLNIKEFVKDGKSYRDFYIYVPFMST